ncbi:MAG: hypothetical protein V4717_05700 [Bacteroidota bacterium]
MKKFVYNLKKVTLIKLMLLLFLSAGAGGNYPILNYSCHYSQASYSLLAIPSKAAHISFFKQYKKTLRQQAKKAYVNYSPLVVLGTVLLSLLLLLIVFGLSYGGGLSGGVIAVIGIVGLVLIIWGATSLLKSMKRKREKAMLAPKKSE